MMTFRLRLFAVSDQFCGFARKVLDCLEAVLDVRWGRIILGFIDLWRMNVLLRRRKKHQWLLHVWLFCGHMIERYERLSVGKLSLFGRAKEHHYEEVDLCCCWWFADLILCAGRIQM